MINIYTLNPRLGTFFLGIIFHDIGSLVVKKKTVVSAYAHYAQFMVVRKYIRTSFGEFKTTFLFHIKKKKTMVIAVLEK